MTASLCGLHNVRFGPIILALLRLAGRDGGCHSRLIPQFERKLSLDSPDSLLPGLSDERRLDGRGKGGWKVCVSSEHSAIGFRVREWPVLRGVGHNPDNVSHPKIFRRVRSH
jgi:hypothetical protein